MSEFGYTDSEFPNERVPVVSIPGTVHWRRPDGYAIGMNGVRPVQVVGPGQVAVDVDAAKQAEQALRLGNLPHTATHFRAALAAAADVQDSRTDTETEHAPATGQGETCEICNGDGWLNNPYGENDPEGLPPQITCHNCTPDASGGGTESDGDQGEHCAGSDACDCCGGPVNDEGDCIEDVLTTQGTEPAYPVTTAAEPDRVTLPDPTPPIVWSFADEEPWRPEHITLNGAKYVLAGPPKADDGFTAETYRQGYAQGVRDADQYAKYGIRKPPKADPAETDSNPIGAAKQDTKRARMQQGETDVPMKWRPMDSLATHIKAAEDRAAKRGRDEALAVVVEALREAVRVEGNAIGSALHGVANDIDSARADFEAGGDGHE